MPRRLVCTRLFLADLTYDQEQQKLLPLRPYCP